MAHCSTDNLQPVVLQFDVTFNTRRLAAHIYPPKWSQKPVKQVKKLHNKVSTQIKSLSLVDISFFAVNIVRSWNILVLKSSEGEIIWQLKKTLRIFFVNDIIFCIFVPVFGASLCNCEDIGRYIGPIFTTEIQWTIGGALNGHIMHSFVFQNVKTNFYFIYGATKSKKCKF